MSDVTNFLVDQYGNIVPYGDMSPTAMKRAYDKMDEINYIKSRIRVSVSAMSNQNNTNLIPIVVHTYQRLITKVWLVEHKAFRSLLQYVSITPNGKIRLARNQHEISQSRDDNRATRTHLRAKRKYLKKHFLNEDDVLSYMTLFQLKYPFITWQAMANVTKQFQTNLPTLIAFVAAAITERILESIDV